MKPILIVFFAVAGLVFAAQVLFGAVILQITFGFANETVVWQIVSSVLVAGIVSAIFAQISRPRPLRTFVSPDSDVGSLADTTDEQANG